MKLAMDFSALEGAPATGVERCARELAAALARVDGVELTAYARRNVEVPEGVSFRKLKSSAWRVWWRRLHLAYAVGEAKAQHLHAPTSAVLAPRGFTVSRTVHDVGRLREDLTGEKVSGWRAWRERRTLAATMPTVFPSEAGRRAFLELFPDWSAPSEVIPHGVESEFFDDEVLPTALPTGITEPFALVLGTQRERRRPDRLERLFREPVSGLSCVWAGEGPEKVAGEMRFLGSVDDRTRRTLLDRAAVVLVPSRFEGFGLPGLEALARRRPVVASDIDVFREVLGDHAEFADFSEADSAKAAIAAALEHSEEAKEAGRRHAASYTWDGAAEAYLAFFCRLATAEGSE